MQSKDSHKLVQLLCMFGVIACTMAASVGHIQTQGVEIYNNGTHWICDRIICPTKADRCHVSKSKSTPDSTVLVRENICYSKDNDVLVHRTFEETVGANQQVSLSIDSFRNGGSMIRNSNNVHGMSANHVDKELELKFGNVNNNIENNVDSINREVEAQLLELQRQLQQTFSNIF